MRRTDRQNRALFLYLTQLANELNAHGIDQRLFLDNLKAYEIPITKEFLHEVFKRVQAGMFLTDSTTKLETDQVSQVYDAVNMFTSTVFGVSTPFPSEEELCGITELSKERTGLN